MQTGITAPVHPPGLRKLTNEKAGEFYGVSRSWGVGKRRGVGMSLLYKAHLTLLNEGHREIRQCDVVKHWREVSKYWRNAMKVWREIWLYNLSVLGPHLIPEPYNYADLISTIVANPQFLKIRGMNFMKFGAFWKTGNFQEFGQKGTCQNR